MKVQTHGVGLYEWRRGSGSGGGGGDLLAVPAAAANATLLRLANGTAPAPALGDTKAGPEPYSRANGSISPAGPLGTVYVRASDPSRPVDFAARALRHLAAAAAVARGQAGAGAKLGAAAAQGGEVAKKLLAIKQAAPWLTWQCGGSKVSRGRTSYALNDTTGGVGGGRCAYRLVVAEMWCRTPKGRAHAACRRPTSTVAYREYA